MAIADLVVKGRIATFGSSDGIDWVEAIAIGDGRVLAVGTRADIEGLVRPGTLRIDLPPETVAMPGIVDAHLHLADAALAARAIDLEGLDVAAALAAIAATPWGGDAWIVGAGWDPEPLGRWPTADDLDLVAPGRRVLLWSHDRHALWVSRAVLRDAGLDVAADAGALDPAGGAIRRDDDGRPTGVLHEAAVTAALHLLPSSTQADVEVAIDAYARALVSLGVTGVHDPGGLDTPDLGAAAIARLSDAGRLPVRVLRSVRPPDLEAAMARGLRTLDPLGEDPAGHAQMGWLKLFADGALGSRTALLVEPYAGTVDHGIAVTDPDELQELTARSTAAGIVPQIHAIGDAALRTALEVLDVPEDQRETPRTGPMRRVEHVQLARAEDLPRFARSAIAASIQPIHLRTDRGKAFDHWGRARSERDGFRIRSLLAAGAVVAFGTDAPVEPADPWPGIVLAVTRRAAEWGGPQAFGPDEAIDLATALRAATVGPAMLTGDPTGGRLVRGARADLIVIPAAAIEQPIEPGGPLGSTRPDLVLVGGREALAR